MATEENKSASTTGAGGVNTSVETSLGGAGGLSMSFDEAGEQHISSEHKGKSTIDLGSASAPPEDEGNTVTGDDQVDDTGADTDQSADDDGSGAETTAELPEFKADDPESVAAYGKAFTKDDGAALNLDALSAHWWSSIKDGDLDKGTLGDGTYKYLSAEWGISEDQVKQIERGLVADRKQERSARVAAGGGHKQLQAAILWGSKGGYTTEQRQAFNAAFNGPDQTKAIEAVELLMARFERASKSGVRPRRTATENASTGSAGSRSPNVFHSRDEWQAAVKEAGRDPVKRQSVSDKFRRSPGAKSW